jgi:chromate transport protein ChrA
MTLIDLRIFTGYITLQLAMGAWIATNQENIACIIVSIGLLLTDTALAIIASALLYNNYQRRKEVKKIVDNCSEALGYEQTGLYLQARPLNVHMEFNPWIGWYLIGIAIGFIGVLMVILGTFDPAAIICFLRHTTPSV